ncbi:zinc ABC transporter substrate-binding protein [Nesterenkonia sp.]|uniref:metal ABC transporter solute-binding protein, Zn/Mn family n=1 Tax=Nesterenkonia sp. TaxID=704201 RepID=UPI00262D168E|nr:zinc ABC transporter substrate-binding protein [Nesterenkonia sp.]
MPRPRISAPVSGAPLLAAGALLLSASACGQSSPAERGESAEVVATFSVLADIASAVAGDRVAVDTITPVGAEVHEYDPSPSDVAAAAEAELIIANGLGLETWFEQFIQHGDAEVITATEDVEAQRITHIPGHPHSGELPTDPHAWISPVQAMSYVDTIEAALAERWPQDAEHFSANAEQYRQQLRQIAADAASRAEQIDGEIFLVTCEGAFSYLANDLGMTEHYLWPLNAENEGTPQQVQAQIDFVKQHQVPVVFCESTVPTGPQEQVAESTGAELGPPLYVDSLSEPDGDVPSYLDLLEHNIDTVLSAYE